MAVYRVVVLVNLALAVGALAGYLWRQSEIDALRNELNRARLGVLERGEQSRQWSASGIVRGTLPDRGALVITHEPLGGLMGAMTMAFAVADPRLLGVARAGERVRFTVVERDRDFIVMAVEREEVGAAGPR
ncbi:MAG TPA: copper-binding protein [Methylomirabilota bacterium]|jgi:Cu/Ag efflux protein CusF